MSVYVDPLIPDMGWGLGPSCHLFADTRDELHEFAGRLGLLRRWFQDKSLPHYDLTAGKRMLALYMGAIELDRRQAVEKWRAMRLARNGGCAHASGDL